MNERYQAKEGSETGHGCCFKASVIDTERPGFPDAICECLEMADAEFIAKALNSEAEARKCAGKA